jgi:hypothetical protein
MRMPSVKRLVDCLNVSIDDAKLIRSIGHECKQGGHLRSLIDAKCPETAQYVRSLHNDPYHTFGWRRTIALHAMDCIVGTCGVEGLGPPDDRDGYAPPYEYLNTGDTYAMTLVYCRATDSISLHSWGDIAEKHPNW